MRLSRKGSTDTFKIQSNTGFYIGDICYALSEKVYDNVWGRAHWAEGSHVVPDGSGADTFAVVETVWGDGYYPADSGHYYPVDAGNIGIVPLELCEKRDNFQLSELGRIVPDITGEVTINRDEYGVIRIYANGFPVETIYTDGTDEDDEEDDEEDFWEDDWDTETEEEEG